MIEDPHQLVRDARVTGEDAALHVHADSVERAGDAPRALLIHLQCELARLERSERRAVEIGWELDALLAEHGARWRGELPALEGVEWTGFERGFPSAVRVRDVATLARHADAIAAAAPVADVELIDFGYDPAVARPAWLRVLRIPASAAAPRYATLFAVARELELVAGTHTALDWLAELDAGALRRLAITGSSEVGHELLASLVGRPWVKRLTALEIGTAYVGDNTGYGGDPRLRGEGARLLLRCKQLERLDVDRQQIGVTLGKVIAGLPHLRAVSARECACKRIELGDGDPLDELELGRNAIGSTGAQVIAHSPRTVQLRSLGLDTCEVDSIGVVELTRAPLWQTLRRLELSRNPLGVAAIRALIDAPAPAQLHTLALADSDLDDRAGAALGKLAWLGGLVDLDLSGNPLGRSATSLRAIAPEGLRRLSLASIGLERTEAAAIARFWPHLVELELSGNALTDAGLERFVGMKPAAALQTLRLRDCGLTDDGLELLASRARCPRLRTLELAGNRFGAGLALLLRSPLRDHLETLDLSRCGLTAAVIERLVAEPLPPRLARLDLRGNELGQAALLALAEAPALRAVREIRLDGTPWLFPQAARERLAARFGPDWFSET